MMSLHTLLQNQITAHLGAQPVPADWAALLAAISTTYADADAEHTTLRRQNEYLATLRETTIDLLNHAAELEARVTQRTAELEKANHELEREIAERMRTEGLLRERESSYRLLAEYATDVISRHTADGTYLYVSPSCITMLGYSADELLGRSIYELLHPEDAAAIQQLGLEMNPKITNYTICSRFRRRDGSYTWLETNTRVVRTASGRSIESVIAVSRDISERRRVEAALEQERRLLTGRVEERTADLTAANVELARAARLKDEFLANMSHELRTPLNGILGLSEALQEQVYGAVAPEQHQALQTIIESGQHLLTLINDILDLSKIEAGKLTVDLEHVEIARVCQASLRMIRQVANQKQVSVELKIDPALSSVRADERRLKQILVNLLSNAVKFTPTGGRVGLDVQAVAAREEMRFTVWDTGIGIASGDIPRLFQPFSQLDSRLARQYEGTGLGLALVARMTELHGGRVGVSSKPGEGSQFSVALPWLDAPFTVEVLADRANAQPVIQHSGPLLLVEDNEANIKTYADYLTENGYRVTTARSGAEAMVRLGSAPVLILMDIQMPGEDGLDTIRQIRCDSAFVQTPIIALTALAMPGDRDRCLAAGADAYLSKPISLRGLLASIETLLRRERRKD